MRPSARLGSLYVFGLAAALGACTGELHTVGPTPDGADAWSATPLDAYVPPGTDAFAVPGTDAFVESAPDAWAPMGDCVAADLLFSEDFESGGPRAFTGMSYDDAWGNGCQNNATQGALTRSGSFAQRSEIVCASSEDVHRGYGGLQFSGDRVLSGYTNTGTGLVAPNGVVSTHWVHLRAGAPLQDGRWVSFFTVNPSCDYSARVVTIGLDQPDGMLHAAHYWPEGSERLEPGAVPMPREQWVRLTILVDLDDGILHVWQDGRSTLHVTSIVRAPTSYCQWHWGLYASGNNTDVVLYEDDFALHRLAAPWTDWSREPWIGGSVARCP
jgi:hypothetical protein